MGGFRGSLSIESCSELQIGKWHLSSIWVCGLWRGKSLLCGMMDDMVSYRIKY